MSKICSVEGCGNKHHAKGLCQMHYQQAKLASEGREKCSLDGCCKPVVAKGLCRKHYSRIWRNGSLEVKKYNDGFARKHFTEYRIWQGMLKRCYNEKCFGYNNYGGRGIKVCNRWLGKDGFHNFYNDMGDRPNGDYSLDRIDNNSDYCPENCRWATRYEQSRNRRNNILLEINGEKKTLAEWAIIAGVSYSCLINRYNNNWPVEKILLPSRNKV